MAAGAALTSASNTFAASQTINGNLTLTGGGGIHFADGTILTSATSSETLSASPVVPPGYVASGTVIAGNLWFSMSPMPIPRLPAAVPVNGKIYVIGGGGGAEMNVFDPSLNAWTPTPSSVPVLLGGLTAAVAVNEKIYCLGEFNGDPRFFVFDTSTNDWTTATPMPTPRRDAAAAVVNGKIYLVGGQSPFDFQPLDSVEAYDPSTNTWSSAAPLPTARVGLKAVALNGNVYAVGGRGINGALVGTLDAYNPGTNGWTTVSAVPTPRFWMDATVADGKIYLTGGFLNGVTDIVEMYDSSSNSWSTVAPMLTARYGHGAAEANGLVYVFGGVFHDPNQPLRSVEQYSPSVVFYKFLKR